MLCSSSGYSYNFEVYCAKQNADTDEKLPLGSRLVLDLLKVVEQPTDHTIFDNYFTNFDQIKTKRKKLKQLEQ